MPETYRIIITQYGVTLGKHSERLVVKAPLPPRVEADGDDRQMVMPFAEREGDPPWEDVDISAFCVADTDGGVVAVEKSPSPRPSPQGERGKKPARREKVEIPFFRISELLIATSGVSVSSDLIEEMCQRGIPITFMTPGGRPYANLTSPNLSATVITRREQLRAFEDGRGVHLARNIVAAKVKNQAHCLKYFGKYLHERDAERYGQLHQSAYQLLRLIPQIHQICGDRIDCVRENLLGLEGVAGRIYWDGVGRIFADKVEFNGRAHREAGDPVNAALNYGYGILYSRVWGAALYAGLEPFAGFLHVDRPGKPSLILDLVEEFRQPVVDRSVIAYFNLGQEAKMTGGLLDDTSRKAIAERVNERLESVVPYNGQHLKVSSIIQAQVRHAASFLRGEREYKPYVMRW